MLPPYCEGCTDPVPCCDSLYVASQLILDVAWQALLRCGGDECCAPIQRFVAASEPHLAMQDYLVVWPTGPDVPLPRNQPSQGKGLMVQAHLVTYTVKLSESGYPTIEQVGTEIDEQPAAALDWAAWHSLAHAEAVWRGVNTYVANNDACGQLKSYTGLQQLGPLGGTIGWRFSLTTEATWR